MTPEQVAEYLQVKTDAAYRLIRRHQLAASKIGRTYRISKEAVDTFLLSARTTPRLHQALVERVAEIGKRNAARYPELASDQVLEEMEAVDAASHQRRAVADA